MLKSIHLGVNLENDLLFEGMWSMPDGISINSYIIQGKKTAKFREFRVRETEIHTTY